MTSSRARTLRVATSVRLGAFSLIELLIALAIIIILFTMMYGFGSKKHQLTQKQKCLANLQKIFIGLQIYATEHGERFPVASNAQTSEDVLNLLVPQYTADNSIFICPGSKDRALPPGESLRRGRISYAYYMGRRATETQAVLLSDRQLNQWAKTIGSPVFSADGKKPANNHHKFGGNFLLGDGSGQSTPALTAIALPLATNIVLLNPKP